ncbi:hypothetical protein BD324DRAFT_618528 [Kockovaella imperatae]|uniref:Swi5-dependent recombination DNA repair protein 1 n=1 Tax=Kockovaella imperatae TaxID=4999 RepID=A0A1Y1UNM9_9TREE|nr:hypothetical protein BD324DRAFT_618528 [Kockovaella imperatae]ORX39104.1 hypothetical protein BD324DRAFT_618528 [Kockovaella imperatae]
MMSSSMADQPPSRCKDLIPYRPHFFPIPWKCNQNGHFSTAQLQPIPQISDGSAGDNTTLRYPRLILNHRLAEMLFRNRFTFPAHPPGEQVARFAAVTKKRRCDTQESQKAASKAMQIRVLGPSHPTSISSDALQSSRQMGTDDPIAQDSYNRHPSQRTQHTQPESTQGLGEIQSSVSSRLPEQIDLATQGDMTIDQDWTMAEPDQGDAAFSSPLSPQQDHTLEHFYDPDRVHPALFSSPTGTHEQTNQWRVGKMPGHQGSHSQRFGDGGDGGPRGIKRTLNESITDTAQRVLKRPFITPKPIVKLARCRTPTPEPDETLDVDGQSPLTCIPPEKSRVPAPFPLQLTRLDKTPVTQKLNPKLTRPFKTPVRATPSSSPESRSTAQPTPGSTVFDRSQAPSPNTYWGSSTDGKPDTTIATRARRLGPSVSLLPSSPSKLGSLRLEKNRLLQLETRARQLREALSHKMNGEGEEKIEELTERWLAAGRDIAERLFDRAVRPDTDTPVAAPSRPPRGTSQGRWSSGQDDDAVFSSEEKDWLDNVARDEDGDPVDEEGNKLVDDIRQDDLIKALNHASGRDEARQILYVPSSVGPGTWSDQNIEINDSPDLESCHNTKWSIGTMLARCGVDPDLLGWDAENDAWIEGDF